MRAKLAFGRVAAFLIVAGGALCMQAADAVALGITSWAH